MWDTRAKSAPILRSPLSSNGHKHSIYSLAVVGTPQANSVVTVSTDGLVCTWQTDMLSNPTETVELLHTSHSRSEEVSVTSFGFPGNESSSFWVGTLEGNVYQANRHDRAGYKAGIHLNDTYRGHCGSITGLHFHPINGAYDFSELMLTSSVDWTVKLWKVQSPSKPTSHATIIEPLLSFENATDYIADCKWSPVHPAVFTTVDASGNMDVWNLNCDTEVPIETVKLCDVSLNKVAWDKSGARCASGNREGRIFVHEMGSDLFQPHADEFTQFQKNIHAISQQAQK